MMVMGSILFFLCLSPVLADDWPWETLDNRATKFAGVPRWKEYREKGYKVGELRGIPRVLHRSHNLSVAQLAGFGEDTALGRRVAQNVASCARVNPKFETRWYEDRHLDGVLDAVAGLDPRLEVLVRTLRAPPLAGIYVLRADVARLGLAYLRGGWWLDADAVCLDALGAHLPRTRGCVLAWEGAVGDGASAPLNWALGCPAKHAFPLDAALLVADRVASFAADRFRAGAACAGARRPFCATGDGVAVPVLDLTGPAAVGAALAEYAGVRSLDAPRAAAGEVAGNPATWAAVTTIENALGPVTVLPYCFFRSRGCGHLDAEYDDRVLFHHEFDTDWRPTRFHNYLDADPPLVLGTDEPPKSWEWERIDLRKPERYDDRGLLKPEYVKKPEL